MTLNTPLLWHRPFCDSRPSSGQFRTDDLRTQAPCLYGGPGPGVTLARAARWLRNAQHKGAATYRLGPSSHVTTSITHVCNSPCAERVTCTLRVMSQSRKTEATLSLSFFLSLSSSDECRWSSSGREPERPLAGTMAGALLSQTDQDVNSDSLRWCVANS